MDSRFDSSPEPTQALRTGSPTETKQNKREKIKNLHDPFSQMPQTVIEWSGLRRIEVSRSRLQSSRPQGKRPVGAFRTQWPTDSTRLRNETSSRKGKSGSHRRRRRSLALYPSLSSVSPEPVRVPSRPASLRPATRQRLQTPAGVAHSRPNKMQTNRAN